MEEKTIKSLCKIEQDVIQLMTESMVADDKVTIEFKGSNRAKYVGTCKFDSASGIQSVLITKNGERFFVEQYDIEMNQVLCNKLY